MDSRFSWEPEESQVPKEALEKLIASLLFAEEHRWLESGSPLQRNSSQTSCTYSCSSLSQDGNSSCGKCDPGFKLLRHGNNISQIHSYFQNLEPRRYCLRLTARNKILDRPNNRMRLVRGDSRLDQNQPREEDAIRTSQGNATLDDKDSELYEKVVLCSQIPVLSAPPVPSPYSPSPSPGAVSPNTPRAAGQISPYFVFDDSSYSPPPRDNAFSHFHPSLRKFSFKVEEISPEPVHSEKLRELVRRAFSLNKRQHISQEKMIRERFHPKSSDRLLVEDLLTQLSLLHKNFHPYYRIQSFLDKNGYDQWVETEKDHINRMVNRFWNSPLPSLTECYPIHIFDAHKGYKTLLSKLIREESTNKLSHSVFGDTVPTAPLSPASCRLLREFGLRYGVGELYRRLIYLKYMVDHFEHELWYIKHVTDLLGIVMGLVQTSTPEIYVKEEFLMLIHILSLLFRISKYYLTRVTRLFPLNSPPGGVASLVAMAEVVQDAAIFLKSTFPAVFMTVREAREFVDSLEDESFDVLLSSYLKEEIDGRYERFKVIAIDELGVNHYENPLSPQLLNILILNIRDEIISYKTYYQDEFKRFLDFVQLATVSFYHLLMEDVRKMCELIPRNIPLDEVDLRMLSLAFRLSIFDKDNAEYLKIGMQTWREPFLQLSLTWMDVVGRHLERLVPVLLQKDQWHVTEITREENKTKPASTLRRTPRVQCITRSDRSAFTPVRWASDSDLRKRVTQQDLAASNPNIATITTNKKCEVSRSSNESSANQAKKTIVVSDEQDFKGNLVITAAQVHNVPSVKDNSFPNGYDSDKTEDIEDMRFQRDTFQDSLALKIEEIDQDIEAQGQAESSDKSKHQESGCVSDPSGKTEGEPVSFTDEVKEMNSDEIVRPGFTGPTVQEPVSFTEEIKYVNRGEIVTPGFTGQAGQEAVSFEQFGKNAESNLSSVTGNSPNQTEIVNQHRLTPYENDDKEVNSRSSITTTSTDNSASYLTANSSLSDVFVHDDKEPIDSTTGAPTPSLPGALPQNISPALAKSDRNESVQSTADKMFEGVAGTLDQNMKRAQDHGFESPSSNSTIETAMQKMVESSIQSTTEATPQSVEDAPIQSTTEAAIQSVEDAPIQGTTEATSQSVEDAPIQSTTEATSQSVEDAPIQSTTEATSQSVEDVPIQSTTEAAIQSIESTQPQSALEARSPNIAVAPDQREQGVPSFLNTASPRKRDSGCDLKGKTSCEDCPHKNINSPTDIEHIVDAPVVNRVRTSSMLRDWNSDNHLHQRASESSDVRVSKIQSSVIPQNKHLSKALATENTSLSSVPTVYGSCPSRTTGSFATARDVSSVSDQVISDFESDSSTSYESCTGSERSTSDSPPAPSETSDTTKTEIVPLSSSVVDLLCCIQRLTSFACHLCKVLIPNERVIPGSDGEIEVAENRARTLEIKTALCGKLIKIVKRIVTLYMDDILAIETCGMSDEEMVSVLGQNITRHLIGRYRAGEVIGCHLNPGSRQRCNTTNQADKKVKTCPAMCKVKDSPCGCELGAYEMGLRSSDVIVVNTLLSWLHDRMTKAIVRLESVMGFNPNGGECQSLSILSESYCQNGPTLDGNTRVCRQNIRRNDDDEYLLLAQSLDVSVDECSVDLEGNLNAQEKLMAYRLNEFFKRILHQLLSLSLPSFNVQKRLQPAIDFLRRRLTAMRRVMFPDCFMVMIKGLWRNIAQDFIEEVELLKERRPGASHQAELLLMSLAHLMQFFHNQKQGLGFHELNSTTEPITKTIELYTSSTARLIRLYQWLYGQMFSLQEEQVADDFNSSVSTTSHQSRSHSPADYLIESLRAELHATSKCFSGTVFVQWVKEYVQKNGYDSLGVCIGISETETGIELGQYLLERNLLVCVTTAIPHCVTADSDDEDQRVASSITRVSRSSRGAVVMTNGNSLPSQIRVNEISVSKHASPGSGPNSSRSASHHSTTESSELTDSSDYSDTEGLLDSVDVILRQARSNQSVALLFHNSPNVFYSFISDEEGSGGELKYKLGFTDRFSIGLKLQHIICSLYTRKHDEEARFFLQRLPIDAVVQALGYKETPFCFRI